MPAATPDARGPDPIPGSDSSVPLVLNPISVSDSRTSPRKQAVRQMGAIHINPETAESRGPRTMTGRPTNRQRRRSRTRSNPDVQSLNQSTDTTNIVRKSGTHHPGTAVFRDSLPHTAESPHTARGPIPNPTPDLRTSPRTPPQRRAETADTNPETAEPCGPRTSASQPPNRPRPRSRTKSNLGPRFQVQSTGAAPAANRHRPQPAGNSGIPQFFDHHRPVAQQGTQRFQCSPRPESDFGVRFPNRSAETGNPADGHNPHSS